MKKTILSLILSIGLIVTAMTNSLEIDNQITTSALNQGNMTFNWPGSTAKQQADLLAYISGANTDLVNVEVQTSGLANIQSIMRKLVSDFSFKDKVLEYSGQRARFTYKFSSPPKVEIQRQRVYRLIITHNDTPQNPRTIKLICQ